jgi:sterol desaturase/sphingolipid hydroxylase (fatty acid hydroxylase superfamily)
MRILAYAAAACVFAEFVGYWVHILLHSHRVAFLSRSHMIHHLAVYSPDRPMRPSEEYLESTHDRASVLGIGLEWILPLSLVLGVAIAVLHFLRVRPVDQFVFLAVALAWGFAMFGYVHDAMHRRNVWLEKSPAIARLFRRARKLHDVHHMSLADDGTMAWNYGICFFFFDRLFGSLRAEHARFNSVGFAAARKRYAYALTPR